MLWIALDSYYLHERAYPVLTRRENDMRLTKRSVEAITLPDKGKRVELWDSQLSGFGVQVTASGNRSYIFQYRMGGRGTSPKRITIGRHGNPWTADGARQQAQNLFELVRKGLDPKALKEEQRTKTENQMRTESLLEFGAYANFFLEQYIVKKHIKRSDEIARIFERDVIPALSGRLIHEISKREFIGLFDRIGARSPSTANKAYRWLMVMLNWAEKLDDIPKSPLKGLHLPFPEKARERVLNDAELVNVWHASDQLGYPFGAMVKLLIATGQRRNEVAQMEWLELDLKNAVWNIPGARTKNGEAHMVPLNGIARATIDEIMSGIGRQSNFVLTTTGKSPISGFSKAKRRLDAILLPMSDESEPMSAWTFHDLRRSVATGCQRLGVPTDHIEAILNHSGNKSSLVRTYQRHHYAPEKAAGLAIWGDHLASLLRNPPTEEQVHVS